jgi:catechol 2,3-dioxygenase
MDVIEPAPRVATQGIAGVGLVVRDLAAALAFYGDALGLEVIDRTANEARLGAGGVAFLDLTQRRDALPDDPREAGLFHTAFLMPSRAALADWLGHAAATGVALDGASDHLVSEAIYLSDPEGNGVEVYADRSRGEWAWDGGHVRMTTLPLNLRALMAARSGQAWRGAAEGTRIGHVHLRVGNVGEAVRFWSGTVGLDVVAARSGAAFLSTGGYHHHIACNVWQSRGAGRRDPERAGLAYVAMNAPVPHGGLEDPWGTRIAFAPPA